METTSGILQKGGTILRSSRTNVKKIPGGLEKCLEVIEKNKLDALIALGGDDTQSISLALSDRGVKCVGVPKTIDNDLSGTDVCFGFDTAVSIATEAVDRLHSTAEAHNRILVVEVMGRDAGWIAITAGIAGGADAILVPEIPIDIDEVCRLLKYRHDHGKKFGIVVAAEGAQFPEGGQATHGQSVDSFGHARLSGIGQALAEEIEKRTKYETRSVNLGHTQRGGTPTAYDRMLATRYGVAAIDLVHEGQFGRLVVLKGTKISDIPLADAIAKTRTVTSDLIEVMKSLQPKAGAV
jgi:6-phosphofructokinase 1